MKDQKKMEGSVVFLGFFESVDLFYYSLHKTKLRKGKSYVGSSEQLRNRRAIINPQNKDDNNCFQYAITVPLNHH